ncbi:asparagine--tRNA ligase [Lacunimicrobium album]
MLGAEDYKKRRLAYLIEKGQPGEAATAKGWVRTRRDSKEGFSFIELNDGSSMKNLQIFVDKTVPGYEDVVKHLPVGASIAAEGELKESPGKGQRIELVAKSITVYGTADPETYPLQKKRHSFEFLREIAHLRPRTNTFGAIARVRNAAAFAIHSFFQARGFMYVNTPIITTSDCEGAGHMFQVTTLDLAKLAQLKNAKGEFEVDYAQDFFGKKASLTVSGQLEGEIFATSLGDCYTFGPTFRAENSNTSRHLAEFWMVEPEMPFTDLEGNMDIAESFIKTVVTEVMTKCAEDLDFFNQWVDKTVIETLTSIRENRFERVSYTEAVDLLTKSGKTFEYPVSWGIDLQSEHERWLTEEHFKKPVILYNYPRTLKPFYMKCNDDGKTVRAMDILVPRIGEIIGGSQREENLETLKQRMAEWNLPEAEYWWYLELRKYGTVPHAGFGLGFERLIQLLTGMTNIRDCIPFHRTPKNAEF